MELSSALDTYRPNSAALFRSSSGDSKTALVENDRKQYFKKFSVLFALRKQLKSILSFTTDNDTTDLDLNGMYSSKADWGAQFKAPTGLQNFDNPNGLSRKQQLMVRSAIKYWVERHKHVVR